VPCTGGHCLVPDTQEAATISAPEYPLAAKGNCPRTSSVAWNVSDIVLTAHQTGQPPGPLIPRTIVFLA
jgi:hypothetical protein